MKRRSFEEERECSTEGDSYARAMERGAALTESRTVMKPLETVRIRDEERKTAQDWRMRSIKKTCLYSLREISCYLESGSRRTRRGGRRKIEQRKITNKRLAYVIGGALMQKERDFTKVTQEREKGEVGKWRATHRGWTFLCLARKRGWSM